MKKYLSILLYSCSVNGEKTSSFDVSVKFFLANSDSEVREKIYSQEGETYKNEDGENVTWELKEIMSIDKFDELQSGEEVVGFITQLDTLKLYLE